MNNYPLAKGVWNAQNRKKLNKNVDQEGPHNSTEEIDFLETGAGMNSSTAWFQVQYCDHQQCSFMGASTIHEPSTTFTLM